MNQTAVEWLTSEMLKPNLSMKDILEQAKEMEKKQQGYSEEEAIEFFIEGYKQRAELSNLIFDNTSRELAIALFKQFKNK